MRFLAFAIAASTLVLPARDLDAQRDTVALRQLVVTAARLPQPRAATTATVTVLDAAELQRRGARTVADALRLTPSAAVVQNGSMGAITSLFLRGGESDYVQVLIDGVRANHPGGVYDFANLTLDNIERIEIVRGPVSVLYGSDAVAGVVQIFTRDGGPRRLQLRASAASGDKVAPDSFSTGRYATSTLSAELSDRGRALGYSLGLAHTSSDGLYAFNNGYRNTTASVRAALDLGARTELDWTARFTDSEFHYPTDGNGRLIDRNQYRTTEAFNSGLGFTRSWSRLTAILRGGVHQSTERYDDEPDAPSDTLGTPSSHSRGRVRRSFAELGGHYNLGSALVLSAGAEVEEQEDRNRYQSSGQFPFSSSFGKSRTNRALYAQALYGAGRLNLNAGARGDSNDRFGEFLTYRAGAALTVWTGGRIRAAAGTAFKEPTFFENYAEGFTRGNPALAPEHTRSWEIGIEQALPGGLGRLQVTHFRQRFQDLIQYMQTEPGSSDPNYGNVASARADGVELELSTQLRPALDLSASFTTLTTEATEIGVEDPAFESGQPLLRRPSRQGAISATYTTGALVLDGRVAYVGTRADLDFSSWPAKRVELASYTVTDLGLIWTTGRWALTGRVENLLDARYQEVLNFPARGRSLSLGVTSNLAW